MANFNINKFILGGRLTSVPELKQTPSGLAVCTFTVAVNRKTNKDGEQKADFLNCTAWKERAEFISRFFTKGSSICVVGSVQTRTYTDKEGKNRTLTEVNVDEVYFVDSKGEAVTPKQAELKEIAPDEDLPF